LANFQDGLNAYNKQDYATALKEWQPLAKQGNADAFAALKADGSITTWGESSSGGKNASNVPTDNCPVGFKGGKGSST
jgi:hypothetical protein